MSEDKRKHLEMIQAVINRLNSNSFAIKTWAVGLVSVLFVLAAQGANQKFAIFAVFPAVAFWGLDAYYLRLERLFRKLYDAVRISSESAPDESYSMNVKPFENDVDSQLGTMFVPSIVWIHGAVLVGMLVVTIVAWKLR